MYVLDSAIVIGGETEENTASGMLGWPMRNKEDRGRSRLRRWKALGVQEC